MREKDTTSRYQEAQLVPAWRLTMTFRLLLGMFVLLLISPVQVHAEDAKTLSLTVSLQHEKVNDYNLLIELKNTGASALSISDGRLPWGSFGSMIVLAVGEDGEALPEVPHITNPSGTTIQINPGETIRGQVYLNKSYPDLPTALKKRDIIIFWSYQPQLTDGKRLERTGGWLIVPKVNRGSVKAHIKNSSF